MHWSIVVKIIRQSGAQKTQKLNVCQKEQNRIFKFHFLSQSFVFYDNGAKVGVEDQRRNSVAIFASCQKKTFGFRPCCLFSRSPIKKLSGLSKCQIKWHPAALFLKKRLISIQILIWLNFGNFFKPKVVFAKIVKMTKHPGTLLLFTKVRIVRWELTGLFLKRFLCVNRINHI